MLEADITHWEAHGFGPWLHRLADGTPAARGGLWRTVVDGKAETEVQYTVASRLWGRGLATEIASAAVVEAFETLGLERVVCFTMVGNHASQRVMEKAGFQYERHFMRAGLPHLLYRLSASAPD
jgi:ribosomal-protein-alanine N-acetyltransferase